jgi:hypothetical protein
MWWDHLPASAAFCDVETTGLGNDDRIACTLRSKEEKSNGNPALLRVGMSITTQPKAPLLLGPGPGQRACKRRDGEARRRGAVEQARDDSW